MKSHKNIVFLGWITLLSIIFMYCCATKAGLTTPSLTSENENVFLDEMAPLSTEDEAEEKRLVEKYVYYRHRLHRRFLVIGKEQGQSLPADARDNRHIHFGDSTVFLGWYMGILATEYYLQTEHNLFSDFLSPRRTLRHLYFALKTLKRLMDAAPSAFEAVIFVDNGGSTGFFIRDDVDSSILFHFPEIEVLESDFLAEDLFDKEESQDQLIHLMLGLSLVKSFIPMNTAVNGVNLIEECKYLAFKMCSWPAETRWNIKNPYCGNKIVKRGAHAYFFSYPIVSSLQSIRGQEDDLSFKANPFYKCVWKKLLKLNLPLGCTTQHLILTLGSISDSWGEKTLKHLMRMSRRYNWPIYPMVNIALYSDNLENKWQYIEKLLNVSKSMLRDAPDSGISHDHSPPGWKASHRFLFDLDAQNEGQDYYKGKEFPGVDFLLLHNVYQIIKRLSVNL